MQRKIRAIVRSAVIIAAGIGSLGDAACFPRLPLGTAGYRDYQALGVIPIPGGVFNAAALNTRFEHEALSIDTKVGPGKTFKMVYNTGSRAWSASWEMSYLGSTFVDQLGTVYDLQEIPFGSAIPGTYWVVVDADTIKTKGGLTYHFDAAGRLLAETWSVDSFPQLAYAWGVDSVQVEECVSLVQQQSGQCRLVATIRYGPSGAEEIVDEVSAAAGVMRVATYTYDDEGMILEAKTPRQQANDLPGTRYEYNRNRLLTAQILPDGERIEYDYAQAHLFQVLQLGEENPVNRFDYYSNGNGIYAVVHTSPLGGRTRYTFTAAGEVTRIERLDLAVPEVLTVDWHPGLERPSRIVDFDGSVRQFPSWDDDDPTMVIEPSGNTVRYTYEPNGVDQTNATQRPIAQISDDLGPVLTITYDPATGLPIRQTNGEGETTTFEYLGDKVVSTTAPWGDTTDFTSFGAAGYWLDAEVSSLPEVTIHRKFDRVGNPIVAVAGLQRGGVLDQAYDRDRRLQSMSVAATDENGLVTSTDVVSFTLRGDGQPLAIQRPLGADHEFEYDALGRTRRICERVEGTCHDTTIEYNPAGEEAAVERPNGMREEFDYDAYGRATAHRALLESVLEGEATVTWEAGHVVSMTDSVRNETRTLAYEPGTGHLQSEMFSANGESRLLTYDARSRVARETLIVPPPTGMEDPIVLVIGYDYDLANRLVRVFVDDGSPAGDLLREWVIEDGRVTQVHDGNGDVRETLFDPQSNRVIGYEMTDATGHVIEETTISRSVEVGPTRFQVSTETATALASTREEYWLNRPGSLLDPNGRVGMRVFRALGWDDGVLQYDRTFHWDALSNPVDDTAGDAFTYNGDRTRLVEATGNGWSHSYQYDDAGYVTSRDGLEIAWTATGRVARVGPAGSPLAEATWDLSGGLISMSADGETRDFTYFGGRVERDATTGGPGWLHLGGVSLPFVGAERRYRHADFRGNTSVVADETGAIVSHRRYQPFGLEGVHGTSGSGGSSMLEQIVLSGFAGGVAGQALGLSFNGARVLDADTGRFLSPDPLLQILSQVSYANGNPVLFADRGGDQAAPAGPSAADYATAVGEGIGVAASIVNVIVQAGAFNAAGAGAATLLEVGVAVTAASAPFFISVGVAVGVSVVFVATVVKIVQATQAALDNQKNPRGQRKELELGPGELQALEALFKLGFSRAAAMAARRPPPGSAIEGLRIDVPTAPDLGISTCSPVSILGPAASRAIAGLAWCALALASMLWIGIRARGSGTA